MESKSNQPNIQHWGLLILSFILLLLGLDQTLKLWVKMTMTIGQEHRIASWFRLAFVENEGMAYGITIGSKLFLTLFRIVAMSVLGYYLMRLIRLGKHPLGFLACIALVLAGGIGNILDSVIYGQIFTESTYYEVARLVPWGEGYAPIFYGHVVDMFYFPMIEGHFPDWLPIWGGEDFIFFRPVFNLADAYISVAIVLLLIFYPRTLAEAMDSKDKGKSKAETPQANQ